MYLFTNRSNVGGVIYKMLRYLSNPILFNTIQDELDTHPDYDTLLAVTDVLTHFGVSSQAYRITNDDLQQVPVPFIANTQKKGSEFLLVTQVSADYVVVNNGNGPSGKISRQKFKAIFSGVVLAINQENVVVQAGSTLKQNAGSVAEALRYPVAFLLLSMILLVSIATRTQYLSNPTWPLALTALFKTAGLITAILLLVQSINSNNPLIQKICGGKNTDCNAILSSDAAKVFEGLTWSEVGFFYFAGTWLVLLFGSGSIAELQMLAWLNLISLPYTVYSIYYQARVAKQWCILCCTVQALLWLEFVPLLTYLQQPLSWPNVTQAGNLLIALLLPVALWLLLKPMLLQLQKVKPTQYQLRRLKYNTDLFNNMLKGQPQYALPDEDWSIVLGNTKAKNVITMVSNPYCSPCNKTHQQLSEWLGNGHDLQVRVVFTANNDENDNKTPVVRHLMALNELPDKNLVEKALHGWYAQKEKKYESWAKAYPVHLDEVNYYKLDKQNAWCQLAEIKATPTLLVNGFRLPEVYQLQDIEYLL